jgi:metal-dependent amidase/aminoacylase/carboxypeptidase family protein
VSTRNSAHVHAHLFISHPTLSSYTHINDIHSLISCVSPETNIIPSLCEAEFQIRAPTREELLDLHDKVSNCLEASALATGCRAEIEWSPKDLLPQ